MENLLLNGSAILSWSDIGYSGNASLFICAASGILFRRIVLMRNDPVTFADILFVIIALVLAVLPFFAIFSGPIYVDGKLKIYVFTLSFAPILTEVNPLGFVISLPLVALFFYLMKPINEQRMKNALARRAQLRGESKDQAAKMPSENDSSITVGTNENNSSLTDEAPSKKKIDN